MSSKYFSELGFIISQDEIDCTVEFLEKYLGWLEKYEPNALYSIRQAEDTVNGIPKNLETWEGGDEN